MAVGGFDLVFFQHAEAFATDGAVTGHGDDGTEWRREVELAADGEHRVADGLGIESAGVHAPEQLVVGIGEVIFFIMGRVELIDAAADDALDELFEAPTIGDELLGQMIEQLRMRWGCAAGTEVVHGLDEASAEEPVPDAIHDDACGERVVGRSDPISEFEPSAVAFGNVELLTMSEDFRQSTRHCIGFVVDAATDEKRAVSDDFEAAAGALAGVWAAHAWGAAIDGWRGDGSVEHADDLGLQRAVGVEGFDLHLDLFGFGDEPHDLEAGHLRAAAGSAARTWAARGECLITLGDERLILRVFALPDLRIE